MHEGRFSLELVVLAWQASPEPARRVGFPNLVCPDVRTAAAVISRPEGRRRPTPMGVGRLSRRARRALRSHYRRLDFQGRLVGVPAVPTLVPVATDEEFPPLPGRGADSTLATQIIEARTQRGSSTGHTVWLPARARQDGSRAGSGVALTSLKRRSLAGKGGDGWVGTPFLERVGLSALAAAGVSKRDAQSNPMMVLAKGGDPASMKARSSAHRANWILRSGSRVDAQLSFVGRALPPASTDKVKAAIDQHRVDYTSPYDTPGDHVLACRDFVRRWAKRRLVKPKSPLEAPAWPSGSSCYERSAKKGGTLSFLLEQIAVAPPPIEFPTDGEAVDAAQDASLLQYALGQMEKGETPRHRVAALAERGLKTRVVTVGPAWCQVLGHAVRKHLLRGLKATPGAYQPLVGASDEDLLKLFEKSVGDVVVSTDLTRATDLLPLDLCAAVVDGLADSGKLSSLEIEVLRVLTGPQLLEYPGEGAPVLSQRGILMGLPTSWAVLSLIHLYWLDFAKHTALACRKRTPRIRASICGDDALLSTTVEGAAAYRQIVVDCGGKPSEGKHYESTSGHLRRAVFLERLYEWSWNGKSLSTGVRFPAIPVKGLTSRNLPRDFLEDRLVSCRSFGVRQILCLDSLASQNPILEGPCRDYMIRRVAWLPDYAANVLELVGQQPLCYGGFRFAPRPGDPALAVAVRDSGKSFSLAVQRELDPLWRMACSFSEGGRELAVAEGELIDLPPVAEGVVTPSALIPEGFVESTEERRFLRTVLPMYRQVVSFSTGTTRRTIHLRANDFIRSLKALRAKGLSQPSGLPPGVRLAQPRIAWRLPNGEAPERGLSWYSADEPSRPDLLRPAIEAILSGCPSLASRCKSASGTPFGIPGRTSAP